jgi:hypothetical protein
VGRIYQGYKSEGAQMVGVLVTLRSSSSNRFNGEAGLLTQFA